MFYSIKLLIIFPDYAKEREKTLLSSKKKDKRNASYNDIEKEKSPLKLTKQCLRSYVAQLQDFISERKMNFNESSGFEKNKGQEDNKKLQKKNEVINELKSKNNKLNKLLKEVQIIFNFSEEKENFEASDEEIKNFESFIERYIN